MTDESQELVGLRVELDRRINFAMQQNDVPIVKALHIDNRTAASLRDIEVRISVEPAFARNWVRQVAAVHEEATYTLEAVDLELSPSFLGDLTERVQGLLRAEVWRGAELLAHTTTPIELLARDEWGGLSSLPEILAAFVLPNNPAIESLLRSAAEFLSRWTGDPSLNGYQSHDPRRAYAMAAAVYAALQKEGLTYAPPPASFEDEGQRVRLPDHVMESRMATCLDVALLAAGCLEQAGLNALVVLVRGHAFAGVWLLDESFPEAATDDGLRLRKRVDLNEIVVFDPTGATARPALVYEQAVTEAKRYLDDSAEKSFLCAIDIRRARRGRIRPLPERVAHSPASELERAHEVAGIEPAVPDVSGLVVDAEPEAGLKSSATRLDQWRRKLLDLSLRNRLLNFRDTKKTLPLLCPDHEQLEDMLADGTIFQILPRPADLAERDPRDPTAHLRRTGQEAIEELLREELKARRLCADTTPEELDRRMVGIYRAARLGVEEGGASALYLAIGFLAWYETEKSAQRRLAPILLLPIELHRKSVREGFTMRLTDDDPRINVTLLELLKQDYELVIPGLDPLPEDDSGLDVAQIFRSMRQAVRDIDRWDVLDEVRIGLFSFTKSLMWRDLNERVDDLMKNPVVDHLANRPDQPFDGNGEFPPAESLDEARPPTVTFCPLPADSSQLVAVFAAAEGRSFVLEGPPGTGKSQTIANMIAHCLAEGKTVLFVSEKMAALTVVQRRLVSVGLGRSCLELHSNKAQKREVIRQIHEASQRPESHDEAEWEREAHRLADLRSKLNAYVRALHQVRSTGETVFQATSRLIGLREAPRVDLRWPASDALDAEGLATLRDVADRLATAGASCGEVKGHAWEAVRRGDWMPGWEEEVHRAIAGLRGAAEVLDERARACSAKLGLGESGWNLSELDLIREVTLTLMASPTPPTALLVRPDWDEIQSQLGAWIERGRDRDRLRAEMQKRFCDDIVKLDLDDMRRRTERASAAWWPASWWRRRPVRRVLKGVTLNGVEPAKLELAAVLDRALTLRQEQRKLDAASDEARALLGRYWNDGEADWDGITQLRDWAGGLRALASRAAGGDAVRGAVLRENWARLESEGHELLRRGGSIGQEFAAYGEALDAFKKVRSRVAELLDLDVERAWGGDPAPDAVGRVRSSVAGWQSAARQLRDWCAWRRVRVEAVRGNLAPLVEAYEQGSIQSAQLPPVFERSYAQWWLGAVTDDEAVLSQFFSPEHNRKIEQFRAVDDRYMQLTRLLVQARLAQRVPVPSTSVLANSEKGILDREAGKSRRQLSVRQLLQKIPNLLTKVKPCLLMSPMSVAQYLGADYPPFDVVIFDEASQIPVWDAVGAIARGRQAVIVGDPKQLPPTSFFQRAEDDEEAEEDEVAEDLPSILEDCIAAQIPCQQLDWHYRSLHESLIAFSNYHYYGNRLLTFPSPALEGLGVSWRHVPHGVYDMGRTRTNRAEAEAVVQEILRRLRDPELAKYSIGVVTFSQAQQTLIEDLLDAARAEEPELDRHFAEDADEPVFVKNLENVQGDEREVILFSICYGPDSSGHVSLNFGPINRDGGERRLNVAITRARREVVVFSTLKADQIDLARTRARGARDLKGFLEYAERGPAAIAQAIQSDPDADFDSPFEEAVFDALVQRGWEVHKQVGCARYRIDLAVVDPEAPGRYLLGVECDGANYRRAKTARDRDNLRGGVLRKLGWNLHRIWSTDWWTDAERETRKIEEALKRARDAARDKPLLAQTPGRSVESPACDLDVFVPALVTAASAPVASPASPEFECYRPIECLPDGLQIDFYERSAALAIQARLIEVVRREGPISLALAARRVAAAWGFERVRSPALERIRRLIPESEVRLETTAAGEFLWLRDVDSATYVGFRVPDASGNGARQADDLPLEEIGNAAVHVLERNVSAPLDELVSETARIFGFQRVGRVVDERFRKAIGGLVERGIARLEGEAITLLQ
jgi:very-short-patch-repair endonuclease